MKKIIRYGLAGLLFVVALPLQAQPPLTEERIADWIGMRIETANLQNRMKANASDYDDLPRAFFRKRDTLLEKRGWTRQEFESVEKRIMAAQSALDFSREQIAQLEKDADNLKSNSMLSESQKQQGLKAIEQQKAMLQQQLDATSADHRAVSAMNEKLEHLTSWVAGNRDDPPELD